MNLLTLTHLGGDRYKLTVQMDDAERARIESGEEGVIQIHDVGPCQVASIRGVGRQDWMLPEEQIFVLDVETVAERRRPGAMPASG